MQLVQNYREKYLYISLLKYTKKFDATNDGQLSCVRINAGCIFGDTRVIPGVIRTGRLDGEKISSISDHRGREARICGTIFVLPVYTQRSVPFRNVTRYLNAFAGINRRFEFERSDVGRN